MPTSDSLISALIGASVSALGFTLGPWIRSRFQIKVNSQNSTVEAERDRIRNQQELIAQKRVEFTKSFAQLSTAALVSVRRLVNTWGYVVLAPEEQTDQNKIKKTISRRNAELLSAVSTDNARFSDLHAAYKLFIPPNAEAQLAKLVSELDMAAFEYITVTDEDNWGNSDEEQTARRNQRKSTREKVSKDIPILMSEVEASLREMVGT